MLGELTQEEFSATLDDIVGELLERGAIVEPPVNALQLAERLGLTVAWDTRQAGRGRLVRLSTPRGGEAQPSIFVRPDPRRERLQWAVAHEIGETQAWQVFDRLGIDPREAQPAARESVANQLASRLLLPCDWFGWAAREADWDLLVLKQQFATASHELIARRMLDFPPRVIVTVMDQGRRTFRRGNLGGRVPPMLPAEQAAWGIAQQHGEIADQTDDLARVRVWPIHEAQWRREILRTDWRAEDLG